MSISWFVPEIEIRGIFALRLKNQAVGRGFYGKALGERHKRGMGVGVEIEKVEITSKTKPCSSGTETREVEIEHLGRDGEWW